MHYSCRKLTMLCNSFLWSRSLCYQHQLQDSLFLTPAFVSFLPQRWGGCVFAWNSWLGQVLWGSSGGTRSDWVGTRNHVPQLPLWGVSELSWTLLEICIRGTCKKGRNVLEGRARREEEGTREAEKGRWGRKEKGTSNQHKKARSLTLWLKIIGFLTVKRF